MVRTLATPTSRPDFCIKGNIIRHIGKHLFEPLFAKLGQAKGVAGATNEVTAPDNTGGVAHRNSTGGVRNVDLALRLMLGLPRELGKTAHGGSGYGQEYKLPKWRAELKRNLNRTCLSVDVYLYRVLTVWCIAHGQHLGWTEGWTFTVGMVKGTTPEVHHLVRRKEQKGIKDQHPSKPHTYRGHKPKSGGHLGVSPLLHIGRQSTEHSNSPSQREIYLSHSDNIRVLDFKEDSLPATGAPHPQSVEAVAGQTIPPKGLSDFGIHGSSTSAIQKSQGDLPTVSCAAQTAGRGRKDRDLSTYTSGVDRTNHIAEDTANICTSLHHSGSAWGIEKRLLLGQNGEDMSFEEARARYRSKRLERNYTVLCRTWLGQMFTLRMAPAQTIHDVKTMSSCKTNQFPSKTFAVVHDGIELHDHETLEDCGVEHNTTFNLVDRAEWLRINRQGVQKTSGTGTGYNMVSPTCISKDARRLKTVDLLGWGSTKKVNRFDEKHKNLQNYSSRKYFG
ncbi:unnamed protein product [Choristocarpus tenellus]